MVLIILRGLYWEETSRTCQVLSLFWALQWPFNWNYSYNSNFRGNCWECLIYLCRALLLWPTSGGAQLLLASFPSLWQCCSPGSPGPCCCLLTGHNTFSQSTANGHELTCVSAILHLEPWTWVLPFCISVSQTSMVLFQGASVCLDCIPTLQCQKEARNPGCLGLPSSRAKGGVPPQIQSGNRVCV